MEEQYQEIKVETDEAALNRNVYQILMQEVEVKRENISLENNNYVQMEIADDDASADEHLQNNQAAQLNNMNRVTSKPQLKQPMPKPIMHRRCSRIEKSNNLLFHRHLKLRQANGGGHNLPASTELLEVNTNAVQVPAESPIEEESLDSSTASEDDGGEQLDDSGHSVTQPNYATRETDPTNPNSDTAYEISLISVNPLDIAFQDSQIDFSNADGMQNHDVERVEMPNEHQAQYIESASDAAVQNEPIQVNTGANPMVVGHQLVPPAEEMPLIPIENRCDPCAYTFTTAKYLEKHLVSKKHLQKIARLNRQNAI